ncbi:MAG: hypothetical protein GY803_22775 [Chloroflexi bacterium]|nr:hypothetical protein [Chloroflexota bacterium]
MFSDTVKLIASDTPPYVSQQMEPWRLVTSGVAHDFNNLLSSILGQSTLALRQLPEEATARNHIEKVIKAVKYAATLSDHLLTYSKGDQEQVDFINLNSLIEDNLNLLDTIFGNDISIQLELTPGLPSTQVKLGQLQQVVMNLLINAAEAIHPGKGVISIRTGIKTFTENGSRSVQNGRSRLCSDYVYLQIRDDGVGMNAATLNQIFDPFFTTKFSGQGLGLSAIHEIIQAHQGKITVKSQVGEGATFTVYLPCNAPTPSSPFSLQ